MRLHIRLLLSLILVCWLSPARDAFAGSGFVREELRIPMKEAGPDGLEAYVIKPEGAGPFPLAVLNHGTPQDYSKLKGLSAAEMNKQLIEFARRGFIAISVMRRGYGTSGGSWPGGWPEDFGPCYDPDYMSAAAAAVIDLRAAIAFLSTRPDVDPKHIIAVGESAGGYATVALTADPPPGLVAAISFSGGRGGIVAGSVCGLDRLVATFGEFGKRSRIPMLWLYSENDQLFGPAVANRVKDAFVSAGGEVKFIMTPPLLKNGHHLFWDGISVWTPLVDDFLESHGLARPGGLLPPPKLADVPVPAGIATSGPRGDGRASFVQYLAAAPHKAFAMSPNGTFSWRSARYSDNEAIAAALFSCGVADCQIININDEPVSK